MSLCMPSLLSICRDPFADQEVASSAFCGMLDIPVMLYELSSFVFFLIPLVMMVFLYMRMGIRIRMTSAQNLGQSRQGDERRKQNNKSVLQMLGDFTFILFIFYSLLLQLLLFSLSSSAGLLFMHRGCSMCCMLSTGRTNSYLFLTQGLLYVLHVKHR